VPVPTGLAISAIFLFGIDICLFRLAALLVPGFAMLGFAPAVAGALVLIALHLIVLRVRRARETQVDSTPLMHS